ncbi:MAG: RNAse [Marmoricola sp.]|nr:RNAse [Marmoricola sp.]
MLDADENSTSNTEDSTVNSTGSDSGAADTAAPAPAKKAAKKSPAKKAVAKKAPAKKAAAKKTVAAPDGDAPAEKPKRKTTKKAAAKPLLDSPADSTLEGTEVLLEAPAPAAKKAPLAPMVLFKAPDTTAAPPRKRAAAARKAEELPAPSDQDGAADGPDQGTEADGERKPAAKRAAQKTAKKTAQGRAAKKTAPAAAEEESTGSSDAEAETGGFESHDDDIDGDGTAKRRPRRRGGRRRRKPGGEDGDGVEGSDSGSSADDDSDDENGSEDGDNNADNESGEGGGTRRRRRRRRPGDGPDGTSDDPENTVVRVRKVRNPEDEITSVQGSTRLAAKKARRQEGREAGRRRAPIVSEAEFLARRESVERVMVIRQRDDLTQIGVLEDKVLVEHYVARESQTSLIGNVYLGRVQNVLPSMEAAFIDIGKGRNAVLYAGEVNWSALGHKDGQARKIESVLKSGQTILVQVTKDPVGHKGARLTSQVSLPGRFLVYVPDGNTSGISRKLPDTERNRLKTLLKEIVPDTAGVIVRTAAEGATEEELTHDVERLTARWADIEKKVEIGKSPDLLYGEPDLTLKVVRDLFTEDFAKLLIQGDDAWDLVDGYVSHVAPDLRERLEKYDPSAHGGKGGVDLFTAYRVDEQIAKGLDRKVWLPSGGSLVIDRTEAMTVVDVNTGKFTGSGGNLEETVTKNNLEAAEEMVRQLRLRDIGGIIVIDFIDMVLEVNRDLVLRRLVECLGRDRTRHQVAEVTSLGLVQMTRKRIGTGLLEAFSEDCEHCKGRGVIVHETPIEPSTRSVGAGGGMGGDDGPSGRRARGGRNRNRSGGNGTGNDQSVEEPLTPSPKVLAGTRPHPEDELPVIDGVEVESVEPAMTAESKPDESSQAEPAAVEITDTAFDRQPQPVVAPEPVVEPVETTPAPTAEPAAPRVVTTTRRRGVSRPAGAAGKPVSLEAGAPTTVETTATPVLTERVGVKAVQAETPGPGIDPEMDPEIDPDDEQSLVHVPVKRKGTRKR